MPATLRVATYNLYLGADVTVAFTVRSAEELSEQARAVRDQLLATDFASRVVAIAEILAGERVDVVGLQEVARWSRTSAGADGGESEEVWQDFLSLLLEELSRRGTAYDAHAVTANFRGGARLEDEAMAVLGHNVILVRRGSGVRVTGERTGDFARTLEVVTGLPGLSFEIARSWGWVDAEVDGAPFRFVNSHLEAWDEQVRTAQRDELLEVACGTERPLVLVGDFNATPEQVGMPPTYADAWTSAGGGEGFTSGQAADLTGESGLDARIDYVWVRDAKVTGCRVRGGRPEDRTSSGLWPSDHAAVVADVAL